ncbi:hypothetical protein BDY24DRAFT_366676 [Mrakia frigida]|uniref:MARVEL domain-containing protein n=1 Tax=Mrakia frigida TaxID=29902 RepID=UPI003FCC056B
MAPDVSRFTSSISSMFGKATSKLSSSSRKSEAQDEEEGERDEEQADRGPAYRNASGGIGNSQSGAADLEVPVRDIIIHSCILFFTFLGICCFGAVAGFQAKWNIGVSGLSGFALFVSLFTFVISAVLLCVPLVYDKWDKLRSFALALKIPRVKFILEGTGFTGMLVLAFVTTISAFTQKGCKDASADPHATEGGDDFVAALPGWCRTKKAGSIFFWLGFAAWAVIVTFTFLAWRKTRKTAPRDAPFAPPTTEDDFDSSYNPSKEQPSTTSHLQPNLGYSRPQEQGEDSPFADPSSFPTNNSHAASRPSMDAYGAFGGAVPEGYGGGGGGGSEVSNNSGMSRTMQMAQQYGGSDPFSDIRSALTSPPPQLPPVQTVPYVHHVPAPQQAQPQQYYQPQPQQYQQPPMQYSSPPPPTDPYAAYQQPQQQQAYGQLPTPPGYNQQLPGGYR